MNFFKFKGLNQFALVTRFLAMIGLLLVVLPICCIKDRKKKVTAHPLVIIA
jgi:hypothetical protein